MNRPEYPRPQFERRKWLNLNGKWQFDFTDNLEEQQPQALTQMIEVPYVFQSKQSGIEIKSFHDGVWYQRADGARYLARQTFIVTFRRCRLPLLGLHQPSVSRGTHWRTHLIFF